MQPGGTCANGPPPGPAHVRAPLVAVCRRARPLAASRRNQVSVIGGGSGDAAVTVNGLSCLSGFGTSAHVVLEHVVSQGRTTAATPTTVSTTDLPISGGSISVPIPVMNPSDGYHLIITPSGGSTGGNTVTVTNPGRLPGHVERR
jgi:hypothetical protein